MVMTSESKKKKATGGQRVMYTTHHPAWDAKNRHGLPDELPMDYAAIAHIFASSQEAPKKQAQEIQKVEQAPTSIEDVAARITVDQAIPLNVNPTEVTSDPFEELSTIDIPNAIPQALKDLMLQNSVTPKMLQDVAFKKGHFPQDTPIENFPQEYWAFMVTNWADVLKSIENTNK